MSDLRRIEPLSALLDSEIPVPDLGQVPELRWVPPASLLVDESYQRDLSRRSFRLIKGLLGNFAWRKMKPPIVVEVDNGLHCVDGQHTAIAAATLKVPRIPVFVVGAASLQERADAFVAHNRDRIVMSPLDVYRAKLASGDADALDVENVCRRAGIRLRQTNQFGKILIGDTNSVGTVQRLVKRRGVIKARMILESFVHGQRGPIGPAEIEAVEAMMVVVRPATTSEEMGRVIRAVGDRGVLESKLRAATEAKPQKHVLLALYKDILQKQIGGARAISA